MRPHYSITAQPDFEPITTDQAAEHVRIDSEDDLNYLSDLIGVGREYADSVTGRVSALSSWLVVADSWVSLTDSTSVDSFRIYRAPLVAVQSVKYYAPDADTLTTMDVADYRVITTTEPGMIQIIGDLPSVDSRPDAIQIEFTAGYSQPGLTPPMLRHAIKMLVANFYEQRVPVAFATASEIPFSLRNLLENQKIGGWVS